MGLDWDEGPEVGGPCGPYFQTQRTDTYEAALQKLIDAGAAYPCFCTKEELDAKREAAEKTEGGYAGYDRTCRAIPADEAAARIAAGEPHVWRLKVPDDHGPVTFKDAVYGDMSFPIDVMDDMILRRTDGTFTYNFAVVCDDVNMAHHPRHPRRRPPLQHPAPGAHLRGARRRGAAVRAPVHDPRAPTARSSRSATAPPTWRSTATGGICPTLS